MQPSPVSASIHAILGVRLSAFQKDPEKIAALQDIDQYGLLQQVVGARDEIPASLDDLIASGDDLLVTPDDHIFEFRGTPTPKPKAEAAYALDHGDAGEHHKLAEQLAGRCFKTRARATSKNRQSSAGP